ncbi:MAG: hypothetical protein QG573_2718 [Acidobacteriota bacterium]|nr:hypothetical protein [Acidobacteriota bacterium]
MRNFVLFFLVVAALGCQSRSETAAPAASVPGPAASTPPVAAPGEIGVAECDDYLRKWDSCLATKITGEAREQVKVALDATREAWTRATTTPEAKAGLAAACLEAAELASMQVAAYGCTW